jgi:hypothetical protein
MSFESFSHLKNSKTIYFNYYIFIIIN